MKNALLKPKRNVSVWEESELSASCIGNDEKNKSNATSEWSGSEKGEIEDSEWSPSPKRNLSSNFTEMTSTLPKAKTPVARESVRTNAINLKVLPKVEEVVESVQRSK